MRTAPGFSATSCVPQQRLFLVSSRLQVVTWLRCNSSCVDPFTTRNRSLPIGRGVSMAACHHTSNASRCAMPQRVSVLVAGTFARYFSSACEQLIAPMTRQVCAVGVRLRSRVRLRLGLGLGLGLG